MGSDPKTEAGPPEVGPHPDSLAMFEDAGRVPVLGYPVTTAQGFREAVAAVHDASFRDPRPFLLPHLNVEDADYNCDHPWCQRFWPMVRLAEREDAARLVSPADREGLRAALEAEWPWHWADDHEGSRRGPQEAAEAVLVRLGQREDAPHQHFPVHHVKDDGTLIEVRCPCGQLLAGQREDAPLDAAWREAEAALPEAWHLRGLEYRPDVGPDPWQASAGPYPLTIYVYGETPAAALRLLALRLREYAATARESKP